MATNPVYEFLGYKVNQIILNRTSNSPLDRLIINIPAFNYNKITTIHEIQIDLKFNFMVKAESIAKISAFFRINDYKWYESINVEQINSLFFSVTFPFIRKYISDITDDIRGQILIPTLDLRNADMKKGLTLKN